MLKMVSKCGLIHYVRRNRFSSRVGLIRDDADANSNIAALVSTNQQIAARYLYDPFGNTLSASGPAADLNLYRILWVRLMWRSLLCRGGGCDLARGNGYVRCALFRGRGTLSPLAPWG